jgi:transposase
VVHARAKLTPLGRALLVERVLVHGWPACRAAEAAGVSRATAYKWVRRFCEEGPSGLEDRSSAPHRRPHALSDREVRRILSARRRTNWGPHRLGPVLGHPRSTVYGVLRREGVPRLRDLDRPTRTVIRFEKARPGELVHIDVKKVGRIPPGGGHRMLGRSTTTRRMKLEGIGYDYLHVAVDDHSRVAYVEAHPDERGQTAAGFLARAARRFADLGVSVESVMNDNAFADIHSNAFRTVLASIGATHTRIPPYHPQLNGKAERFNRTLKEESGPTRSSTDRTPRGSPPLSASSPSTMGSAPTPRSVADPRWLG